MVILSEKRLNEIIIYAYLLWLFVLLCWVCIWYTLRAEKEIRNDEYFAENYTANCTIYPK